MGVTTSLEKTAAATGRLGQVRRDAMAMLPFLGYHVGGYFQHWVNVGKGANAEQLDLDGVDAPLADVRTALESLRQRLG